MSQSDALVVHSVTMRRRSIGYLVVTSSVTIGLVAGACSSSGEDGANGGTGGNVSRADGGRIPGDIDLNLDSGKTGNLSVEPGTAEVTVNPGDANPPTVQFSVKGAPDGAEIFWRVLNPDFGTIDSNGVFTPSGKVGGRVEIVAMVGDETVSAHVTVIIVHEQNGGPASGAGEPGAGGLGGVGGEGFGGALTPELIDVLKGSPSADGSLKWLYPYDETVFPLGILPPLLQWSQGENGTFEGVYVHLSAPPHYDFKGFYGRPDRLAAGDDFVRHPIPKEVWESATLSAAGKTLEVELVLAAGGKAYGPIKETWNIALAPVTGKIYYQAYGTALAFNWPNNDDGSPVTISGDRFGGATLSIDVGAESPELVAGFNSDDKEGCRVCHSVSAYGDLMVVQHGHDYTVTSSVDLKNGNDETTPYTNGTVGWAGLYPDGTMGLANSMDVTGTKSNDGDTQLYDMATGDVIPTTGLAEFATRVGLPVFSHDGTAVAFTLFDGPSNAAVGPPNGRKLVSMTFDLATMTFSDPTLLYESTAEDERPAWPTFLPSSKAVVFQRRWKGSNDDLFSTWYGARGELWWVDIASGQAAPLDRVNGVGPDGNLYIPTGPNDHEEDNRLNYEPSISPVASGGYAWMVFMSRRLYGNVATMDPFASDPREVNLKENIATKKIWMAAIDLEPEPGKDPSHPPFYIPGQEIHGVNSRPFFALDPCVSDAGVCSSGIDCCTGFCRDGYCIPPPDDECAEINERCEEASDCCQPNARCIGGFCAVLLQ